MKRNNPDINAIIAALGGSPLKKKNQYLQKQGSKDALLQRYLMKNKLRDPFYQKYEKPLYGMLNNPLAFEDEDSSEVIPMTKSQFTKLKNDLESKYIQVVSVLQKQNDALIKHSKKQQNPLLETSQLVSNVLGATAAVGDILSATANFGSRYGIPPFISNLLLYITTFGSVFAMKWLTKKKFEALTREVLGTQLTLPVRDKMGAINRLLRKDKLSEEDMPEIVQALIDLYARLNAINQAIPDKPTASKFGQLRDLLLETGRKLYEKSDSDEERDIYRRIFLTFEAAVSRLKNDDLPYISAHKIKEIMENIPVWAENTRTPEAVDAMLKNIRETLDPEAVRADFFSAENRKKVGRQFDFIDQLHQVEAAKKELEDAQKKLRKEYTELQAQDEAKSHRIETLTKDREYLNQHRSLVKKLTKISTSEDLPPDTKYTKWFMYLRTAILNERWFAAEKQVNSIGAMLSRDLSENRLSEEKGKKIAKLLWEGKDAIDNFTEKYGDQMVFQDDDLPEDKRDDDPSYLQKKVPRPNAAEDLDLDIASLFK